ncbi:hypothetical protein CRG98_018656 [Punica granatum]|uniref:Uncharacterized protein n=1 Tax=Punica granatum TaxID=22663 RepID=A0A2I0JYQ6_PUNGR|nr:hypothetical protein CRG98_018656 [Punica granatum]
MTAVFQLTSSHQVRRKNSCLGRSLSSWAIAHGQLLTIARPIMVGNRTQKPYRLQRWWWMTNLFTRSAASLAPDTITLGVMWSKPAGLA